MWLQASPRRRGATPAEDRALAAELLADPKERAEHLMLLDLGRNDVGRVADIGSIKVTDQFMDLGYHVFVLSTQSPNIEQTRPILYATVLVLLATSKPASSKSASRSKKPPATTIVKRCKNAWPSWLAVWP